MDITGAGVTVSDSRVTGPGVSRCAGRWDRPHAARVAAGSFQARVTIAPASAAVVQTVTEFVAPPWASDTLDVTWQLSPVAGSPFEIVSTAPEYAGQMGVELSFELARRSARVYAVAGEANPAASTGRVELWGYAPGNKRAQRLASVRPRGGTWRVPRLELPRAGRWEFYARYRTAGAALADDASVCGTITRIR